MRAKILIVEDHADSRAVLKMQIEHLRYEVIEARSGEEAIKTALAEKPDLIIMDIGLPGMNGFEAAMALKQNSQTSQIPIVAYSAWKKENYRDDILRAGIVEFLTKPAPRNAFRKVVQRILETRSEKKVMGSR